MELAKEGFVPYNPGEGVHPSHMDNSMLQLLNMYNIGVISYPESLYKHALNEAERKGLPLTFPDEVLKNIGYARNPETGIIHKLDDVDGMQMSKQQQNISTLIS
jgi:hypothetical protein